MLISACSPTGPAGSRFTTPIPTQLSATDTPTFVWFPPTATATRSTTISRGSTPTPQPPLEHGEPVFSDDFSSLDNWETGESPEGSISPGINELSMAVIQPRGFLFSILKDFSENDYYLEITANPTICRGNDEYGVLVRVSSTQDLFRFALTCDGHARLDRVLKGQASASIPPILSAAVPPGAPSRSRLGVWVKGNELRFYVNGQHLFDINDASLLNGGLGVFTRAGGEDRVTVNFSDLIIYSLLD